MSSFLISENSPLRVLFVEDNEVNRFYIRAQTTGFKDSFEFSENGRDAVAKASKTLYDIIFMDINLPVMNGYEAARKIRTLPKPNNNIPIIGITNDSLTSEDIEGTSINDFINKFFSPEELQAKIKLWKGKEAQKKPALFTSNSLIGQIKDTEARTKMIEIFLRQKDEFIKDMDESIAQNNEKEIFFLTHKMKSSIELVGIPELKRIIEQMEKDGKEKNNLNLKANYEELKRLLQHYF